MYLSCISLRVSTKRRQTPGHNDSNNLFQHPFHIQASHITILTLSQSTLYKHHGGTVHALTIHTGITSPLRPLTDRDL